jgi:hypothetical protein
MKFKLLLALVLFGEAIAQQSSGYIAPLNGAILPTNLPGTGTSSSTTTTSTTSTTSTGVTGVGIDVTIPKYPSAGLSTLQVGTITSSIDT